MKLPLIVLCLAVALALLVWMNLPTLAWDGGAVVAFDITVRDAEHQSAVSGAIVGLRPVPPTAGGPVAGPGPAGGLSRTVSTDESGQGVLAWVFPAGGTANALWKSGRVSFRGWTLFITAEGYVDQEIPVTAFVGQSRSIRDPKRIPILIELKQVSKDAQERRQ